VKPCSLSKQHIADAARQLARPWPVPVRSPAHRQGCNSDAGSRGAIGQDTFHGGPGRHRLPVRRGGSCHGRLPRPRLSRPRRVCRVTGDLSGVSAGRLGGAVTLMIAPVVVFSLVIAALWAWSLFSHPQTRCARCTGGTPHFGSFLTGSSGLCRKCGGTGWRERPGVGVLRTLGWDTDPTGRLRRGGEPAAGTRRGPRLGPQSASPWRRAWEFPGRQMRVASTTA
jgi:hypothetical protein